MVMVMRMILIQSVPRGTDLPPTNANCSHLRIEVIMIRISITIRNFVANGRGDKNANASGNANDSHLQSRV